MKRRIAGVVIVCMMCLAFAGCGGGTKVITGSSAAAGSQGSSAAAASGEYVFKAKDVDIHINAEAKEIIDKLGKPLSTYESPSCAFGDLDVYYTYAGFEVNTFQEKKVDYVKEVILKDDSVSTPEGLSIGDDADKVTKAYGEPTEKTDTKLEYDKEKMKLIFVLKSGQVDEIQYVTVRKK
ncbi:MAG: hypothetical protein IK152_10230 [Lachnospiraceae bacterium]|nr:hypothetical protein [Lachnospiraceae bacterium]